MKVLVCGGRNYTNRECVSAVLNGLYYKEPFSLVITGGAAGADTLAEMWARGRGIPVALCKPNWAFHGASAGPIRNAAMLLLEPALVIAFPGGKGTKDMINKAIEKEIRVIEVREEHA